MILEWKTVDKIVDPKNSALFLMRKIVCLTEKNGTELVSSNGIVNNTQPVSM